MADNLTTMLSIKDTAEMLNLSPLTIRRLALSGHLPYYRMGNNHNSPIRIKASDIDRWLEDHAGRVSEQSSIQPSRLPSEKSLMFPETESELPADTTPYDPREYDRIMEERLNTALNGSSSSDSGE